MDIWIILFLLLFVAPWAVVLIMWIGVAVVVLGMAAYQGAVALFHYASEQGFVGLVAYVAAWVFMFPIMLVVCVGISLWAEWEDRRFFKHMQALARRMRERNKISN